MSVAAGSQARDVPLVAGLVFGRKEDRATVRMAAKVAADRRADVMFLQPTPRLLKGLLLEVGLDPSQLERAEILDSRRWIRALIDQNRFDRGVAVVLTGRPVFRSALRTAFERNCSTLIFPDIARAWLVHLLARSRSDLDVVVARSSACRCDYTGRPGAYGSLIEMTDEHLRKAALDSSVT